MSAFQEAKELVKHAESELPKIRQSYKASLNAKAVDPSLLIEIKNFLENLRTALDFSARGLFDQHGSSKKAKPKIYFPYALVTQTRNDFEKSNRIETCIPGLARSRPDLVQILLDMQHFGPRGHTWLPVFMDLTNENKHQRLTPQARRETKELRISGGEASMSLGEGGSISVGSGCSISIGGAVIQGGQSFDVNRPPLVQGGKVETITWVSFHFANGEPVLPFLERALGGVRQIVEELSSTK